MRYPDSVPIHVCVPVTRGLFVVRCGYVVALHGYVTGCHTFCVPTRLVGFGYHVYGYARFCCVYVRVWLVTVTTRLRYTFVACYGCWLHTFAFTLRLRFTRSFSCTVTLPRLPRYVLTRFVYALTPVWLLFVLRWILVYFPVGYVLPVIRSATVTFPLQLPRIPVAFTLAFYATPRLHAGYTRRCRITLRFGSTHTLHLVAFGLRYVAPYAHGYVVPRLPLRLLRLLRLIGCYAFTVTVGCC